MTADSKSTARTEIAHKLKCELAAEVLRASGDLRLQVNGWSMLPSVFPGDTLMIGAAASNNLAAGDIVLFHRQRRLFAHRVVKKVKGAGCPQIVTQGDGMRQPDFAVSENELLGKVKFIVRNGKLFQPPKTLRFSQRAVAALVRRSPSAARLLAGIHGMRRQKSEPNHSCLN